MFSDFWTVLLREGSRSRLRLGRVAIPTHASRAPHPGRRAAVLHQNEHAESQQLFDVELRAAYEAGGTGFSQTGRDHVTFDPGAQSRSFFCSFSGDQPGHALPSFATQGELSGHLERVEGPSCSFPNRVSPVRLLPRAPGIPEGCTVGESARTGKVCRLCAHLAGVTILAPGPRRPPGGGGRLSHPQQENHTRLGPRSGVWVDRVRRNAMPTRSVC